MDNIRYFFYILQVSHFIIEGYWDGQAQYLCKFMLITFNHLLVLHVCKWFPGGFAPLASQGTR